MGSIVFYRVMLLASSVDTVRATQMHVNTELHSPPLLFVPEMTRMRETVKIHVSKYTCKKSCLCLW